MPSSPTPSGSDETSKLDASARHYLDEAGQLDADFLGHYTTQWLQPWIAGERAIQLGLGNGVMARQLAPRFREFTVVEGSSELAARFDSASENCRVVNALFEEFMPPARVDRIFGNHILEHVSDPVAVLRRTRDWLAPAGRAIFTVPNATSLHRRIGVEMGLLARPDDLNEQDRKLGHRRVYTAARFRADLEAAGFLVDALSGYMLKVVSNQQMQGWSRPLLDAGYRVSLTLPTEMCANLAAVCRLE